MCDTIGIYTSEKTFFAKNSDRSPNEPQLLEYHAPHSAAPKQRTTYLTIDGAHANAVLLSRPAWMWGAEMGVNEHGLAIGNEAVFTKGSYQKTGLTGMDLLRLALERADGVDSAIDVITSLLKRYGQGGDCGYDHSFFYDNSFLLADRGGVAVLETCGREWAVRRRSRDSISNRLTIGREGSFYSEGSVDFTKKHLEPLYSHFSASAGRLCQTAAARESASNVSELFSALRSHEDCAAPMCRGSVGSVCMHAGGAIGDQTTASLVVEIGEEICVWATGSSAPCISVFKPCLFGLTCPPVFAPSEKAALDYWYRREDFHRMALGKEIPAAFYAERDRLERDFVSSAAGGITEALCREAAQREEEFYAKWRGFSFHPEATTGAFRRYWKKKNAVLRPMSREFV